MQSLNIIGKYSSHNNPIFATDTDRERTHILVGHRSQINLLLVQKQNEQKMFQLKDNFSTENLKQMSWNKFMDEKIAVSSQNQIIVYDMEKRLEKKNYVEYYRTNNRNGVGTIHHIQWMKFNSNIMFVAQGNMFRIWDLRTGSVGSGVDLHFLSELDFQGFMPTFKVNANGTLIGSLSYDGYIKLFDLRKLGHSQFSSVLYNISSPGCTLFDFDPVQPNTFYESNSQKLNNWELIGDRANLKNSIHSLITATHLIKSQLNSDFIFTLGQGKVKTMQGNTQIQLHGFNIKHKFRPQKYYNLGNINKVMNFIPAQNAGVLVIHDRQKLTGFSIDPSMNLYNNAPCNPILFDQQSHQLIYNLEMPNDIIKRYNKKYSKPILFIDQPNITNRGMSFKQQIKFLHDNYKIMGTVQDIGQQNAKVADYLGKSLVEDMWNNLAFLVHDSTMQNDKDSSSSLSSTSPSMLQILLQDVIDEGQLPSVVYYIIVVHSKNPSLLNDKFITRIFADYIQILRKFQLYYIAARICIDSKTQSVTQNIKNNTVVKIICTCCKQKIPQNQSSCKAVNCSQLICFFCQSPLRALTLWCQGCSHSFHIHEAIQWFTQNQQCPYDSCGHKCYSIMQKDLNKINAIRNYRPHQIKPNQS